MLAIALSIVGATACVAFILFCIGVVIKASVRPRGTGGRDMERRDPTRCCEG